MSHTTCHMMYCCHADFSLLSIVLFTLCSCYISYDHTDPTAVCNVNLTGGKKNPENCNVCAFIFKPVFVWVQYSVQKVCIYVHMAWYLHCVHSAPACCEQILCSATLSNDVFVCMIEMGVYVYTVCNCACAWSVCGGDELCFSQAPVLLEHSWIKSSRWLSTVLR